MVAAAAVEVVLVLVRLMVVVVLLSLLIIVESTDNFSVFLLLLLLFVVLLLLLLVLLDFAFSSSISTSDNGLWVFGSIPLCLSFFLRQEFHKFFISLSVLPGNCAAICDHLPKKSQNFSINNKQLTT